MTTLSKSSEQEQQEEFEKWWADLGLPADEMKCSEDGEYISLLANWCFMSWSAQSSRIAELEAQLAQAKESLAVCQQSLKEQAQARVDPTMPLLVPEVVTQLRAEADACYGIANTKEDRIFSHGLFLLCDWQDRLRTASTPPTTKGREGENHG